MTAGTRFCYVVMCHTDAPGVLRLAERIRQLSPTASVLLRHDQDGFISAEQAAAAGADLLRSDVHVAWGGWSTTRAMVEAFEHARATTSADWYVLVSGQDHPVRDLAAWEAETAGSGADALIAHMPLTDVERLGYSWREPVAAPSWLPRVVDSGLAFLASRSEPLIRRWALVYRNGRDHHWMVGTRRRRGTQPPIPVRKGSMWMTLSRAALDVVASADPETTLFFGSLLASDELYVQSLLAHSPDVEVTDAPTSHARFVEGAASPVWLDADELDAAATSGAAFARKMPPGRDDLRDHADLLSAGGR